MLSALLLVALTALKPSSESVAPVELPETDNPSNREALAVVHNRARRIVPFGGGRYLVVYPSGKANVSGALMRGPKSNAMPYVIVPAAALPRIAREDDGGGQLLDAALLDDKSFAASADALPLKASDRGAIIFYDFGPDHEPNPTLAVRLKGCVGAIAPGPSSSVVALTENGVTVLSRDGVVLGRLLKDAIGCADLITRVAPNRYAAYNAAKQQVILFRLDLGKQLSKGTGPDWRDADYSAASVAEAIVEKTIDVSEGAAGGPAKSLHVDKEGNIFLVRGDTVVRFAGSSAQSWAAGREWGAVYWDGDTLVALTKNAHWQRVRF
ncbi:MAG TPA: hypothetical protein VGR02_22025 [Thermoanaerobaculia bacterium]|jgi:hypothetical protein|nr:hypothetical protein [Thermoanaerobaculia bacterium]